MTVMVPIHGMTCASCVSRVERALGRVPGVVGSEVSLALGQARVHLTPERTVTVEGVMADLAAAVRRAGFESEVVRAEDTLKADNDSREELHTSGRTTLFLAAILTVPLVLPMVGHVAGLDLTLPPWLQLVLATPVQLWAAAPIHRAAWRALRAGSGTMDVLVSLGTNAAYGLSIALLLIGSAQHLYFEASAAVITLVLLGRWLEQRARNRTTDAIAALSTLRPETARVVGPDGRETEVDVARVGVGDTISIRPGDRVPVDGRILSGESQVDESLITGESQPVARGPGDAVTGGSVNGEGLLRISATATAAEGTLARIIRLVQTAQASKAPIQRLVDRVAAVFVPIVVAIAVATLVGWLLAGADVGVAVIYAVTVLVIACPCALGLATPAAIIVGTGVAARQGILIKDAITLERASRTALVVFDKTGTLTEGRPELTCAIAADGDTDALIRLAASAQSGSSHPLAHAVVTAAGDAPLAAVSDMRVVAGRGLIATVAGRSVAVGNARLMAEMSVDVAPLSDTAATEEARGATVMWVAEPDADGGPRLLGMLAASDRVRPNSAEAVAMLDRADVATAMLTGDRRASAAAVAASVGIDQVTAEVLPEDKADAVATFSADGKVVAMVGDGINDAPALAAADVGIALGSGTDAAMAAAGVTLMRPDPRLVPAALDLARATRRKIQENLFWAFIYNVVALPLAAFGQLSPIVAAAAMALSSISVVTNALRLRRWRMPEGAAMERSS